jgi:hypothetical protein
VAQPASQGDKVRRVGRARYALADTKYQTGVPILRVNVALSQVPVPVRQVRQYPSPRYDSS